MPDVSEAKRSLREWCVAPAPKDADGRKMDRAALRRVVSALLDDHDRLERDNAALRAEIAKAYKEAP